MDLQLSSHPAEFAAALQRDLAGRAWLVRDRETGRVEASSPRLARLARFVEAEDHEAVFLSLGPGSGALFGAFVHSTTRGQAQGGVRRSDYPSLEAFLRDGLRLSRTMTRKNALARLWWGGGKGLIACPPGRSPEDPDFRRSVYQEFGAFVSGLRGCYVTAEDAGTGPADMAEIFRATRFATCIPPQRGGAGNPSQRTAAGVAAAMQAALSFLDLGDLAGKKLVLQGTGQVGSCLVALLLERGAASIVASEVCAERRDALLDGFDDERVDVRLVAPGDLSILAEPCDVLAPCALGGVLGPKTIPQLRTRLVCGAANDPLEDEERDAAALAAGDIAYVPDFVANRMGIVSCANEQYGGLVDDPAVARHLDLSWPGSIAATTRRVLEAARVAGTTPVREALRLARELAAEPHPIWAGRGQAILEDLTTNGWISGAGVCRPERTRPGRPGSGGGAS